MFSTRNLHTTPTDPNDAIPVAYDDNNDEIYSGGRTVNYEGKELVWETFRDEIKALLATESGVFTLAQALDLEVTRYA